MLFFRADLNYSMYTFQYHIDSDWLKIGNEENIWPFIYFIDWDYSKFYFNARKTEKKESKFLAYFRIKNVSLCFLIRITINKIL